MNLNKKQHGVGGGRAGSGFSQTAVIHCGTLGRPLSSLTSVKPVRQKCLPTERLEAGPLVPGMACEVCVIYLGWGEPPSTHS